MNPYERIKVDFPHPFKGKTFVLHAIVESARPRMAPVLPAEIWRDNISAVWLNVVVAGYPTNTWALYVLPKKDVGERDLQKALKEFDEVTARLEKESKTSFAAWKQLRRARHSRKQVEDYLKKAKAKR